MKVRVKSRIDRTAGKRVGWRVRAIGRRHVRVKVRVRVRGRGRGLGWAAQKHELARALVCVLLARVLR